jgi:hypothetical protein
MASDSLATSGRFLMATNNRLERVRWYRASGVSQRCGEHLSNELADNTGRLWYCTVAGTPGTWKELTKPSFNPITPKRVYDSRDPLPSQGALAAGQNRTVSIKDGRVLGTGAVDVANLVPAGATAITANVTVANTAGSGFLAINPGGNTTVGAAAINWFGAGQVLNNGVTLSINATTREVTVIAGGGAGASVDFIIDVTGYFL